MRAALLGHACWLLETTVGCFLASASIPPLTDRNPAGYGLQELEEFAQRVLECGLAQYLAQGMTTGEPLTMQYLQYAVSYEIEVVFPNGKSCFWTYHTMAGAERRGKEWIDFMTRDLKVSIMSGGIPESQGGKTAIY